MEINFVFSKLVTSKMSSGEFPSHISKTPANLNTTKFGYSTQYNLLLERFKVLKDINLACRTSKSILENYYKKRLCKGN